MLITRRTTLGQVSLFAAGILACRRLFSDRGCPRCRHRIWCLVAKNAGTSSVVFLLALLHRPATHIQNSFHRSCTGHTSFAIHSGLQQICGARHEAWCMDMAGVLGVLSNLAPASLLLTLAESSLPGCGGPLLPGRRTSTLGAELPPSDGAGLSARLPLSGSLTSARHAGSRLRP